MSASCLNGAKVPAITPVILCGGSGTRLWPLSRALYPKQFVNFGKGPSLFGCALDRISNLDNRANPLIICNEEHRFYALDELRKRNIPPNIILEPEGRNTAPAIALAALSLMEGEDTLMLVLPSDHLIANPECFCHGIQKAAPLAQAGAIIAFGINPSRPETGYGYIETGEARQDAFKIARFVEKPDYGNAQAMLSKGNFLWNSGMFLMRPDVFLEELQRYSPEIMNACQQAWQGIRRDAPFCRPAKETFLSITPDSIDYAVMEKTDRAMVVPVNLDWSDLGSWEALYRAGQQDENGNVVEGDVLPCKAENCYLNSRHRLLAALDVRDLVIVETADAVLVASRKSCQEVKKIVERLNREKRRESSLHTVVQRPWGNYETLAMGDRFQVKRIIVNPGAELSLQMHHHRAEHWVVVSGTAQVANGEETLLLTENQSIYIPIGKHHSLKNPGVIPLVLIEIQSGSYLGEDDIVRFADCYGRC